MHFSPPILISLTFTASRRSTIIQYTQPRHLLRFSVLELSQSMSSTSLVQSTSTNSLSRSANSQSQSQSPATKVKNAITHPIAALTPQKGPFSPSGAHNASPAVSTPGRWQHPRMEEIVRRQNSSCFNPGDSRIVVLNAAAIVFTFITQPYLNSYVPLALLLHLLRLTFLAASPYRSSATRLTRATPFTPFSFSS